jgi:glycosyltransferase involved in cell wall biosynthesis
LTGPDSSDQARSDASSVGTLPDRVLLWMPHGKGMLGGHVVQIEKTARALGEKGVAAVTDFSDAPPLTDIDLVHGFGLSAAQIRRCHTRRVLVALSPIYWDRSYRAEGPPRKLGARSVAGRGYRAALFARAALRGRGSLMEANLSGVPSELELLTAYASADLLLPNAVGEADSIRLDFGVSTPMAPVPNGVDPLSFSASSAPFEDRRYVLFVGRIDPHKNQLGAIRALRGSGLPLVIAGHDHPHHPGYAAQCREEGGDWVTFTGEVAHDSAELADLYHGARVHLLPSWFETTGLVSLEAALSGCSVVSTSLGHAREYLDDLAWYCDPHQPSSILTAVRQAWDSPPTGQLRQRILDRYTWEHVAEATIAAYRTLVRRSLEDPTV